MSFNADEIDKKLRGKKNYRGIDYNLSKRVKDGVTTDEDVITLFVSEKEELLTLGAKDILPHEVKGIKTDIIVIGRPHSMEVTENPFLDRVRPLVGGLCMGNEAISWGTLGYFFKDKNGTVGVGTNTHVGNDRIDELSIKKRNFQPGVPIGGDVDENFIGDVGYHAPLKMTHYGFNDLFMIIINILARIFRIQEPFDLTDSTPRHLDFAWIPLPSDVLYELKIRGLKSFNKATGMFFAGSRYIGIYCKMKYILEAGFTPIGVDVAEAEEGDMIYKVGAKTRLTSARVLRTSVKLYVDYSDGSSRPFEDVVMTEPILLGGDSGSLSAKEIELE